ncbi:hypothetical protein [Velocimicrobium porci]|uniref:Uncharacterized protein n=1 Tax=Velocimicrobium porci TaxID=2606634 RepID=A0A6L5Y2H6_9FIRM|nr:hypothetical protein [Velocimicrobium porci]MSS64568.1 hypothetical protein [Velocimicrobium porci]DAN97737.1 MAG TPA: hypothetical protein [Caudoviricetes sp.]
MTRWEILRHITGVKEVSRLLYDIVQMTGSIEELTKELSSELTKEELQVIQQVAQSGNYPLSFDGKQ